MKSRLPDSPLSCRIATALLSLPLAAGGWALADDAAKPAEPPPEAAAEKPAEEAAKPAESAGGGELKNWVEFGVGGSIVNGHVPAYEQRYGLPQGAVGGIESFHFEQAIGKDGKDGTVKVDGRAIFDNNDYRADLEYAKPDVGYVKTGYREFRSYSDASGGYFPPTDAWFSLYPNAVYTDNSTFYAEVGLRAPKLPEATVRYEHGKVDGQKSSTIWGSTTLTGGLGPRAIVPTVMDVDRIRDLVMVDLAKTFSSTKVGVGLRLDKQKDDDATLIVQNPYQGNQRNITQQNNTDASLLNVHGSVEQKISSKVTFTAGYGYTDLNTDTSGYRVYGRTFDPDYADRLPGAGTYEGLTGGAKLRQNVGNFNLMTTLADKLVLVPSLRVEGRSWDGDSLFVQPALPMVGSTYLAANTRTLLDVTEALDLRYTGVTNWVFYANGTWLQGSGDLNETQSNVTTGTPFLAQDTADNRWWQKYSIGANWYPHRRFNVGAEYYFKNRQNDYDTTYDSTPNLVPNGLKYPAYLDAHNLTTDDINLRLTWRPRGNLTFVARGDLQWSDIESQVDGLAEVQSAKMTSYIVSGNVSWVPFARLFVQGSASQVWDQTETPASDLTPAVQSAKNNYFTANATVGYALDDKTDLEAQYMYYLANDYQDDSLYSVSYGSGAESNGVSVGVVRRMSQRVRVSVKYGFYDYRDPLYGGNENYNAHVIYSTLMYRF